MDRAYLATQLTERMAIGQELHDRQVRTEAELVDAHKSYRTWDEYNTTLLRRSFTTSKPADEYSYEPGFGVWAGEPPLHERLDDFRSDVAGRLRRLDSLVAQFPLYESDGTPKSSLASAADPTGNGVFIVHGRADGLKQTAARTVHKLTGTDPIILHEQADKGRTIIEKFEDHANEVGFAVVLLTGDDTGGLNGDALHARARQNVVFELGYFFGKLGRSRVAVLYEPGVELPSDVSGLLYIEVDAAGGWQYRLGKELRAAGIEADMNKLT